MKGKLVPQAASDVAYRVCNAGGFYLTATRHATAYEAMVEAQELVLRCDLDCQRHGSIWDCDWGEVRRKAMKMVFMVRTVMEPAFRD